MRNNIREFCFPAAVKEAVGLMTKLKSKAMIVAGGTRPPGDVPSSVETVIDITDLPLRHLQADKGWLRIGALCTLEELEKSALLKSWARGVIAQTAGFGTTALARSMGTVGGNVVRPHPYNNLPPLFLALDAVAVCAHDGGEEAVPFGDILKPDIMRRFGHSWLLTELRVPAHTKGWAAVSPRLGATKSDWKGYANCVVAADVHGGVCRKAAVAVSAMLPRATRMAKAETSLAGAAADEAAARGAEAAVVSELEELTGKSPAKAHAVRTAGVLARRALLQAFSSGR